jgi:hypothetical protein
MGDWQRRGLNLKYLERIPTHYSSLVQLDQGHLACITQYIQENAKFVEELDV